MFPTGLELIFSMFFVLPRSCEQKKPVESPSFQHDSGQEIISITKPSEKFLVSPERLDFSDNVKLRLAVFNKDMDPSKIEGYFKNEFKINNGRPQSFENMTRDLWICWKTFFDLRFIFGFKYELVRDLDGEAAVLEDKADVALFMRTITISREKRFSVPHPLRVAALNLFLKKPSGISLRNLHLKAFLPETWYTFFGVSAMFYTFVACLLYVKRLPALPLRKSELCWTVGILTGKSIVSPVSGSEIATYTVFIGTVFGMLIQTFYGDSIISALSRKVSVISSMDDLIKYDYQFTTHVKSEALQRRLQAALGYRAKFTTVDNENQITHLLQRKVSTLAYTELFVEEPKKQNFSDEFICDKLQAVKFVGHVKLPATIMLQKNSNYKGDFNYGIIKIREVGLNYRYYNEFSEFEDLCPNHDIVVFESFGWEHINFPLSIIVGGVVSSAVLLLFEKCWSRKIARVEAIK